MSNFPKRLLDADYQQDIVNVQDEIMKDFGFTNAQMKHLFKYKPSIVLYKEDFEQGKGLLMLKEFLCDEMKMSSKDMVELIVKYPPFLSKTKGELKNTFNIL